MCAPTSSNNKTMKAISLFLLFSILFGCSYIPPEKRLAYTKQLANKNDWQQVIFKTNTFDLIGFVPKKTKTSEILTVYIEGDGFAWRTSRQPSADPTPRNPIGLELALKHQSGAAVYLARPCQFHSDIDKAPLCTQNYWTNKRYAEEVITASEQALTQLKEMHGAKALVLVGYSGGAAIAALLAARRDDVEKLITVAGNLNHQAWTELHNVSPLTRSLNPAAYQEQLQSIPQVHFVGADDKNIPPQLAQDFISNYESTKFAKVIVVPDQTHSCCWQEIWPKLILDNHIFE